jgi:hypothetical protein
MGSYFDSFIADEITLVDIETIALKRAIAWQIQQLMAEKKLTKTNILNQ